MNLIILPFDHRASFSRDLMHLSGELTLENFQKILELKEMVLASFEMCANEYVNDKKLYRPEEFGVLVDELYGAGVISKIKKTNYVLAIPVEKSGKDIFDFENGEDFAESLLKIKPTYAKVLIRYNPENVADNKVQLERLAKLQEFSDKTGQKILLEVLVPATKDFTGDKADYDLNTRPVLTAKAILELTQYIRPHIWKIEGIAQKYLPRVIDSINPNSKIIILGRNASDEQVCSWLKDASIYPDVVGFAVGRSVFFVPLQKYLAGNLTKDQAIQNMYESLAKFTQFWYEHTKSRRQI
jgi:myo-inositol catabolism protein IolC